MGTQPVAIMTAVALVAVGALHAWPGLHLSRLAHGAVTFVVVAAAAVVIWGRVTPWHPGNPNANHPQREKRQ